MANKLLTRQDLADRWQVSLRTIDDYKKEGIIQPVKGIPATRFTEQHILELEGVKLDRMSPLERRRLEADIEKLKKENIKLKSILTNVLAETSQVIGMEAS
ncbi:MAG: hypothetical protein ABFC28_01495 [Rikenellaceae bacterium]